MLGWLLGVSLAFANATEGYPLDPSCLTEVMNPPRFPPEEFRRGIHGQVILEIEAEPCGRVRDVRVAGSSGNAKLDAAAVRRARKWDMPFALTAVEEPARWSVQVTFPTPSENPALGQQGNHDATVVMVSAPKLIQPPPQAAARLPE